MHHSRLFTFLTAALLAATLPVLHAAELGEPAVKSHVGQQLVADVELLPDAGGAVRASIAPDDVYQGANIARSPVIDTLNLSVMRRDGRQYLHITSIKPVEAAYLHLFLDLVENGKHTIRPATLWLQPELPEPVVPVRPPVTMPVPVPVPALAPMRTAEVKVERRMPAAAPSKAEVPDLACRALDYKNAQLSAQIVDLEEKVKALQYAIDMQGTKPAAPAKLPPQPRAAAAAARPGPARQGGAPAWPVFAGIGVVALGGGGWWFRRVRRMRSSGASGAAADSE